MIFIINIYFIISLLFYFIIFIYFIVKIIYFGSSLLHGLFSSCSERGLLLSRRVARASHCGSFSCGAWTLGPLGFGSCSSQTLKPQAQ